MSHGHVIAKAELGIDLDTIPHQLSDGKMGFVEFDYKGAQMRVAWEDFTDTVAGHIFWRGKQWHSHVYNGGQIPVPTGIPCDIL